MKKILLDVNVVLDVLLDRSPHSVASGRVWAAVENRSVEGVLAAHSVTTIFYLVRKERGNTTARKVIGSILRVFGVATVDETTIRRALLLPGRDFEDSVTASAAEAASCDAIVTRDPAGFAGSPVAAFEPEAAAALLGS
jgi:predicted nucleic acid-binding protein